MNLSLAQQLTIIGINMIAATFKLEIEIVSLDAGKALFRQKGKRKVSNLLQFDMAQLLVLEGHHLPIMIDSEFVRADGTTHFAGNAQINLIGEADVLRALIEEKNINELFSAYGRILCSDGELKSGTDGQPVFAGGEPIEPEPTDEELAALDAEYERLKAELEATVSKAVEQASDWQPGDLHYYLNGGRPLAFSEIPAADFDKLPDGCAEKRVPKTRGLVGDEIDKCVKELEADRLQYEGYSEAAAVMGITESIAQGLACKHGHISVRKFRIAYLQSKLVIPEPPAELKMKPFDEPNLKCIDCGVSVLPGRLRCEVHLLQIATLSENEEHDGFEITFPGPIAKPMRDMLAGWRFHSQKKLWYAKRTPEAREAANRVLAAFNANPAQFALKVGGAPAPAAPPPPEPVRMETSQTAATPLIFI